MRKTLTRLLLFLEVGYNKKRKYGEGPAPKGWDYRVPWETFKGPVFLNKELCTLLIIGILQGLGIDPKNHGPLGYQRENEEEEEEPVLHLVLDNDIVELDNLPVVIDNETEIQNQNEAVVPNTPAVPVHKAPANFMDDGLSEEEDDPNNSSIHSHSPKRKRKSTEEDLDLFDDIILPHSKRGRKNKGSSLSPQSRSPTPPAL